MVKAIGAEGPPAVVAWAPTGSHLPPLWNTALSHPRCLTRKCLGDYSLLQVDCQGDTANNWLARTGLLPSRWANSGVIHAPELPVGSG